MSLIKKLFVAIASITVVIGLSVWSLTKIIKPTVVNDIINKQLSTLTAQKSHVDGDISWQLFPRPGISMSQVHIGDDTNRTNDSARIDNLVLHLQIAPLLRGHFIFNELKIDGLKLTIHSNTVPNHSSTFQQTLAETIHNPSSEKMPGNVAINYFLLTNGEIIIDNPRAKITLTGVQIGATQFNLKKEYFSLQFKANVKGSISDNKASATINYKGRVRLLPSTFTHPLVALPKASAEGQLLLQNVQFNHLKCSKISANALMKQGEINLNPLTLSLYNGEAIGDLSYQFASKKLSINQTATSLDAKQVFNDLADNNLIKGNMDFSLHTITHLDTTDWQKNTQGNGRLTIKDGVLNFIDLNKLVRDTTNNIHTLLEHRKNDVNTIIQLAPFTANFAKEDETKFQLLSIQYRLLDANLLNDSMLLQTDALQLKGQGRVNLQDTTMDGTLSAKLFTTDPKVSDIQQLLGGTFPLKISGTFKNPLILPDTQIINPIITKYLLKKTLEKPVKLIKGQIQTLLTIPDDLPSKSEQ